MLDEPRIVRATPHEPGDDDAPEYGDEGVPTLDQVNEWRRAAVASAPVTTRVV